MCDNVWADDQVVICCLQCGMCYCDTELLSRCEWQNVLSTFWWLQAWWLWQKCYLFYLMIQPGWIVKDQQMKWSRFYLIYSTTRSFNHELPKYYIFASHKWENGGEFLWVWLILILNFRVGSRIHISFFDHNFLNWNISAAFLPKLRLICPDPLSGFYIRWSLIL